MAASPGFQELICLWRLLCCVIWKQNFLSVLNEGVVFATSYLKALSIAQQTIPWTPVGICIWNRWQHKCRGTRTSDNTKPRILSRSCPTCPTKPACSWTRHSPQGRMSSRAGYTVAHGGRQVASSVQVLNGPTPGLWFVHRALHSALHTFKVKTKTKEKCHSRLNSDSHKHMDV